MNMVVMIARVTASLFSAVLWSAMLVLFTWRGCLRLTLIHTAMYATQMVKSETVRDVMTQLKNASSEIAW
jgi:hypothetical protein